MIKLLIIGSLGKDAVAKEVNGKNVINFSVAHTEKWKDNQGNQKERTTWVEAAYWTDRTTILPYLTKGTRVFCEGAPEADAYAGNDGPKATLRMRVQQVELLGGGQKQEQQGQATSNDFNNRATSAPPVKDDLPF